MSRTATIPEYESLRSASARTGYSIYTFREKIASGELPAYRISDKPGSAMRVKVADVNALLRPVIPVEIQAAR
ncbi:MerR family transcriptional regulator [Mycolicibacterium arenosum]|uniref:DNA-binding protein n=1 Tax=Mycolicibacterium arenosum TaxID=2952157 RepID=A0ABT1LW60_9MYCO|nr:DNA-binding protein [Mycolicibacterium sp. CAU 1645]MCP9271133.1 DNA-binding protein [Mycolicibacterium sp. CAU 1645]